MLFCCLIEILIMIFRKGINSIFMTRILIIVPYKNEVVEIYAIILLTIRSMALFLWLYLMC